MKFRIVIFFLVGCILTIYAADVLSRKVSLDVKSQTVGEVLKKIESQADVKFIYLSSVVNPNQKVSVSVNQVPLDKVLKQLLPNKSVQMKLSGNHIVFYIPSTPIVEEDLVVQKPKTPVKKQEKDKSSETISIDSLLKLIPTESTEEVQARDTEALKQLERSKIDSLIERFKEESVPVVVKTVPE